MSPDTTRVPLNGLDMHLRPSEVESVAAGLRDTHVSMSIAPADALRQLPPNDRAPAWELAVRRFGRRKPLEQAAGEIGIDVIRARGLLERFSQAVQPLR